MKTRIRDDLKTMGWLFSHFRNHPWAMPTLIALGSLSSLAEGFGISLFLPLLGALGEPALHPDTGIWIGEALAALFSRIVPDYRLLAIAGCIFASIILKAILSFSTAVLFGRFAMRISHALRSTLFEKILNVEYGFIEQSPSGKLFNTLSTETWRTSDALSALVNMIISCCVIGVYLALLLLISWKLTLMIIISLTMISLVVRLLTHHVKTLSTDLTHANALFSKRMVQTIEGMKVVRAFARERYEQSRFDMTSESISRLSVRLIVAAALVNPVYEILAGWLLLYVLFTALQGPSGLIPLLVFIFVLYRLQPKIKELDEQRVKLGSLSASVRDVMSLLDQAAPSSPGPGKVAIHRLSKGIRFDRVFFHYPTSVRPALNDVSVVIAPRKTTALVGPSGAGKSTLIKLILRLYEPTKGEIFVEDQPLSQVNLSLWRQRIALVSQDVYLFDATVKENIAYGRLDATEEEIREAAREADAHPFILQLPEGYDTQIGERGVRLSGGQQQRISMARALLRKPEILILDEPTSVLDTLSERLIQDALLNMRQACTVIIIAHRLSTIKQADHIIVLDAGRVCEEGNLNELLVGKGLFARLYELQFPGDGP